MGKHSTITARQISDNDLVNRIEGAAGDALAKQPWWDRRKNSLTAVAQLVLQAANVALFALGDVPLVVTVIVALVISLAEIVVHAATKAPVTPSVAEKISRAAAEAEKVRSVAGYYNRNP